MFDAATWRTKNRKHFALLKDVYAQVGLEAISERWNSEDDAEYAARLVHEVGSYLLTSSVGAATSKGGKYSNRRADKAWKAVEPEPGARAAVFLTLAVAGILAPDVDGSAEDEAIVRSARDLVIDAFEVPPEDLQRIEQVRVEVIKVLNEDLTKEAVERGGLADRMVIQRVQVALSYYGMELAGIDADDLPGFEPVRGLSPEEWGEERGFDWLLTFSIHFDAVWRGIKERFIEMAFMRADRGFGYQLVMRAIEDLNSASWQWADVPAVAVVKTADALSRFREEYNLVLDAIALGYWIRRAELELRDGFNSFDPGYASQLREKFAETNEPDSIVKIGMNEVREGLPAPFAPGPEVWSDVVAWSVSALEQRGAQILAAEEFDEDGEIPAELRQFAIGLGYGLGVTTEALQMEAIQPRQD
ncbi:MAG TPA: hypothetical protein VFX45_10925 [Solirubrobacterales bacterium]|nr:hypothetical protein [Solirubrobacterales bacterium]